MLDADMILYNANIYTIEPKNPKAQAIAIKDKKIAAVGTNAEILKHKTKKTKTIDLKGKTVLPGFTDCHIHMSSYARTLEQVDLRNATSIKQLQQKLKQATTRKPSNVWIVARGFDHEKFAEKRLPTRFDLDEAVPNHPVLITRVCGHLSVANSKALDLAEINMHKELLKSGKIVKDPKTGMPNGVLLEDAQDIVTDAIPNASEEELLRLYGNACGNAVKNGLTGVHWLIGSPGEIRVIEKLQKQGKLPIRVYVVVPVEYFDELGRFELFTGFGDDRVRIGCVKIFADGSLGACTAALRTSYNDNKTTKGILIYSRRKLENIVKKAHDVGFQIALHAIGDRAIETALGAFEAVLKESPRKNHRHRIEHASVLNAELMGRMRQLDVIASVQPHFVVSDFWIIKRLGKKRARWTYALKSLFKSGVNVCAGSDCPVEPINPLLGIWAAVARKTFPEERLSIDGAIRMYTINAAFASFEETRKGSLEAGKLADLVVLSKDPHEIAPEKIRDIKVDMTIVDGEVVYARRH
jgi:predicted amidohydrolase YtcJ